MSAQLDVGQWGMFSGPEAKQLVICDGQPCGPVSARKLLAEVPRRLLLDDGRVTETAVEPLDETPPVIVEHGGVEYRVETRQIVSPWSKTVVGVLAGVFPIDEPTPQPPAVGSWEWVVKLKGKEIAGRRTFWNKELFDLYEVSSDIARASGYWEVDVWASQLVSEFDQYRFFSSLRDGYWDSWTGVRCATFDAVTGYGTDKRGKKHLRLVASQGAMSTPEQLIFQGFSYEVPEIFSDRSFAEEFPTDNALIGFMTLVADPIAIVDPNSLEVLMSTPNWRVAPGHDRSLKEIVVDDPDEIRHFLLDAVDAPGLRTTERDILLNTPNGPEPRHISVVSMDRGPGRDTLAVVRLNA